MITDLLASKRERALRMGADAAVHDPDLVALAHAALGVPADVVFDCVTRELSVAQAVDLVTKGGRWSGSAAGPTPVRMDLGMTGRSASKGLLCARGLPCRAGADR